MKDTVKTGDIRTFIRKVKKEDVAAFESGQVHEVYSTFALARDAEWCCRLFVLDMKEADEEGIGTSVSVQHMAPAFVGEEVVFTAVAEQLQKNEIICSYKAQVGDRLVATGTQGQKIVNKEKLNSRFEALRSNG